jgi:hypothetical protein
MPRPSRSLLLAALVTAGGLASATSLVATNLAALPHTGSRVTAATAASAPVLDPAGAAWRALRSVKVPGTPVRRVAAASTSAQPHTVAHKTTATARKPVVHHVSGPTSWAALNAAIARIPTYYPGGAKWVVENTGWWGTSDWFNDVIYVSPTVPESKLYDVASHEWSHIKSVHDYGGAVSTAKSAMAAYFGGGPTMGPEYAADCMALLQGATWTNYTSCSNPTWRAGARLLLEGHRLPV